MECRNTPCVECPFVKSAPKGWLGPYSAPLELHKLVMSDKPFSCHSMQDRDISFDEVGTKRYKLCKGAIMYMRKNAKSHKIPEINELISNVTDEEKKETFYCPEFIEHHEGN